MWSRVGPSLDPEESFITERAASDPCRASRVERSLAENELFLDRRVVVVHPIRMRNPFIRDAPSDRMTAAARTNVELDFQRIRSAHAIVTLEVPADRARRELEMAREKARCAREHHVIGSNDLCRKSESPEEIARRKCVTELLGSNGNFNRRGSEALGVDTHRAPHERGVARSDEGVASSTGGVAWHVTGRARHG